MRPDLFFLIDHNNVRFDTYDLKGLVVSWLDAINAEVLQHLPSILTISVRAYGGWYQEDQTTESRFQAAEFYQERCPSALIHRNKTYRLVFSFAESLVQTQYELFESIRITHTVVPRNLSEKLLLRQQKKCFESQCELKRIRKWLKGNKACPKEECPHAFSDVFFRLEQKQVDVHLATDLVLLSLIYPFHVAIVSDDMDLIPSMIAVGVRLKKDCSLSWLRMVRRFAYLDAQLTRLGVRIVKCKV